MEMPEGCDFSIRISHISDEKLRPHPDSEWLYEIEQEIGPRTTTGVTDSLERCIEKMRQTAL